MSNPTLPKVKPRPGGWEFFWQAEGVLLNLERLREHKDSITAELTIQLGPSREHLKGGVRVNLTSDMARNSLAKSLTSRHNGADWGGMLEQAIIYTITQFRQSDPFEEVGQMALAPSEAKWRLRPVLPEQLTTMLYGEGGIGKSTLATYLGLMVQHGLDDFGFRSVRGNVLYLDWESSQQIVNDTMLALAAGMKLEEAPYMRYRLCRRPLLDMLEDVKAEVESQNIKLLVIDSAVKAAGGEKEAKENALVLLNGLRYLGCTALLISHKSKTEGARGSYGSVFFENDARHIFEVQAVASDDDSQANIILFNRKSNIAKRIAPIGFSIEWDELLGIKISREDPEAIESMRSQLPASIQIKGILRTGPMSKADIVEELGLPEPTIRQTLGRGKDRQFVRIPGNPPLWALKTGKDVTTL